MILHHSQLGLGDTADQDQPTYVDALRGVGVQQITCGSGHTVALTTDGDLLSFGRGDDGRLGLGDNGWKYVPRMCQALAGLVVTQVTCGSYHTAAVTRDGALHTWGGGLFGKLGHGNEAGSSIPKRVEGLVGVAVAQVVCGSRHTVIVTSTGAAYSWGDMENGIAGHGMTEGHQCVPRLLEQLAGKKIVQLSACGFHTACLSDADELFTWGEGTCVCCVTRRAAIHVPEFLLTLYTRSRQVWKAWTRNGEQRSHSQTSRVTARQKAPSSGVWRLSFGRGHGRRSTLLLWRRRARTIRRS
jgi:alpha-tubulin suppressor-like RCC1 family protein